MINQQTLVSRYGFDQAVISRWVTERGLDMSWPEPQINKWVVDNILNPMRKADQALKNEKIQEEIRLTRFRADQQELDTKRTSGEMVAVNDVADELAQYCLQFKTAIRNLPLNIYLELAEIGDDPLAMKQLISTRIDEVLEELGKMKYEERFEPEVIEDTPKRKRSTKAAKKDTTK